ncbi:MAG TPA: hypothetical protein VMR34_04005 [Candidatus Saccharimonadales bacterium]|jgi:hypothetical protein|nr:hypothetical protein [Candidatus Saccharimonadales bacterium]
MSWTDLESDRNLQYFEYLACLINFYEKDALDFPLHSAYYEQSDIENFIIMLLDDPALMSKAFPNLDKAKLAKAIKDLDDHANRNAGWGSGYGGGFISERIREFINGDIG